MKWNIEDTMLGVDAACSAAWGTSMMFAPKCLMDQMCKGQVGADSTTSKAITQHLGMAAGSMSATSIMAIKSGLDKKDKKKLLVLRGATSLACAGLQAAHRGKGMGDQPMNYVSIGMGAALGATMLGVGLRKEDD